MFSIYDMYLLGGCGITLLAWCLIVYTDKDNKPATKEYSYTKVAKTKRRVR